jgi:hypothetical protein
MDYEESSRPFDRRKPAVSPFPNRARTLTFTPARKSTPSACQSQIRAPDRLPARRPPPPTTRLPLRTASRRGRDGIDQGQVAGARAAAPRERRGARGLAAARLPRSRGGAPVSGSPRRCGSRRSPAPGRLRRTRGARVPLGASYVFGTASCGGSSRSDCGRLCGAHQGVERGFELPFPGGGADGICRAELPRLENDAAMRTVDGDLSARLGRSARMHQRRRTLRLGRGFRRRTIRFARFKSGKM